MDALFTRIGTLTELTIDRYLLDDLSAEQRAAVDAHLSAHPAEQARIDEARQDLAQPLPPLTLKTPSATAAPEEPDAPKEEEAAPDNVVPLFSQRRLWTAATGALAAAAALLLFVNVDPIDTGEPVDTFTARGDWLSVVDVEGKPARVVVPGDKLMFEATARGDGYLLVLGVDGKNVVYPWHPMGKKAEAIQVSTGAVVQPTISMRMDETPGRERIIGLLCETPFRFEDVSGVLSLKTSLTPEGEEIPLLREGCQQTEVALYKKERG
ncbi:MAG: hypothetical protein AAFV53_28820 [Myxococcota bacterium]